MSKKNRVSPCSKSSQVTDIPGQCENKPKSLLNLSVFSEESWRKEIGKDKRWASIPIFQAKVNWVTCPFTINPQMTIRF